MNSCTHLFVYLLYFLLSLSNSLYPSVYSIFVSFFLIRIHKFIYVHMRFIFASSWKTFDLHKHFFCLDIYFNRLFYSLVTGSIYSSCRSSYVYFVNNCSSCSLGTGRVSRRRLKSAREPLWILNWKTIRFR